MDTKLILRWDPGADTLYVDTVQPYAEQDSEELGNDVIARRNPRTGAIENLEVLGFIRRLHQGERLELPVLADLRPAV
jgi:hypothetical protein